MANLNLKKLRNQIDKIDSDLIKILEKGFKTKPFESYLSFFKYSCHPYGGFAPGPTRIMIKIFGLTNVREVSYFYRGVNRLTS